jgi:hypothetical protein
MRPPDLPTRHIIGALLIVTGLALLAVVCFIAMSFLLFYFMERS